MHAQSTELAPVVGRDDAGDRQSANRAIGISAIGLGLAGLIELAAALLSGSVSLLGDSLHNLSDVSTSLMLFLGFRLSKRTPSQAYPYGYERAEDLAGIGVAAAIWLSAVFAGYESYRKLVDGGRTNHLLVGLLAAALGLSANQAVGYYKLRVGRRIQSAALVTDAKHSRLDALSSFGALVGLVLVGLGWHGGDAVAGIAVTIFIVHVAWEVTVELLRHLMDGVDPAILTDAEAAAVAVPGVHHAHIRARWTGRTLLIDVEGWVDPDVTLRTIERMRQPVEDAVFAAVGEARVVQWTPRGMPLS